MDWVVAYDSEARLVANEGLKGQKLALIYRLNSVATPVSLQAQEHIVLEREEQKVLEDILLSNCSTLVYQGRPTPTQLAFLRDKAGNKRFDCLVFVQEAERREEEVEDWETEMKGFKEVKVVSAGEKVEVERTGYRLIDFGQIKFDVQDLNQKSNMKERQWQMEKEMLVQQINYFEQDKQSQAEKQKSKLKSEVEWARREAETKSKDQTQKYQSQIQRLEQEAEKLEEESNQMAVQLDQQKYVQQSIQEKADQQVETLTLDFQEQDRKRGLMHETHLAQIAGLQEEVQTLNQKQSDPSVELAYKRNLKEKEQEVNMLKTQMENEILLITQNKEFIEQQLVSAKKQVQQTKDTYENIIKAMKETSRDKDNQKTANEEQIQQIKVQLEQQFQCKIELLQSQLEKAKSEHAHALAEKEAKVLGIQESLADRDREAESTRELFEDRLSEQQRLSEQGRDQEEQKHSQILLDLQKAESLKLLHLTQSLEDQKQSAFRELSAERESHEQALMEMRTHYEAEREILELKLQDNKGKEAFDKAMAEMQKEFEMDKQDLEEQIEEQEGEVVHLKEEMERSQESNNYIMQMKQQEINNLMKYADDLKGQLKSVQAQFDKTLGYQVARLEEDKATLVQKVDALQLAMKQLEKDNATLEERVSQLDKQLSKKNALIDQVTGQKESSHQEYIVTIEQLKARLQAAGEELLDKKVQSTKDLALLQQQVDFKDQLLSQAEHERGSQEKQKVEAGSSLALLRVQLEEEWKKSACLEQQVNSLSQERSRICDAFEREKRTLRKELEGFQSANQTQGEQFQLLKSNLENEKKIILEEMEKYKRLYSNADQEKQETQNTLDREKTLFQDRFVFLEKQKETYKNDLSDTLRKFDLTLQHLKKARVNEQNDNQKNFKEVIAGLEKKHGEQLKDLKDMHRRDKQAWEERMRQGEPDEEMSLKDAAKEKDCQINHLQMQESKLKEQLQLKQEEYDAYLQEIHKNMETNKEMYRKKYAELDDRLKQSEQQKSLLQFEYEKEKTKWKLERGNLVSNNGEFQEIFQKQQQKRDQLLKENEKLRHGSKPPLVGVSQEYQPSHHTMSNNSLGTLPYPPRTNPPSNPSQYKFSNYK